MPFADPPRCAAWRHLDAREGFEVVFLRAGNDGCRVEGDTAAVEDGKAWAVRYDISVDAAWATRSARVWGRASSGLRELSLEADGAGRRRIDDVPAGQLDGCLDVDLESSSLTNAFPVHRLGRQRYHYVSPAFGFECELVYDESGLVLDYPGIAVRAA
jgi:hypothetical protein